MPNESVESLYEEATRCPKCKLPGDVTGKMPAARPGYQMHTVYCRNKDCPWLDSMWIVQVNPDGSVPPPNLKERDHDQLYPKLVAPPEEEQRILRTIEKQLALETQPGAEVRNRHS